MQLATPSQSNFLRLFSGRLGDRHPFLAFSDMDTFHLVSTSQDWSTYARRMTLLANGNIGIGTISPLAKLDITAIGNGANFLRFSTDRPWVFRQRDGGSISKLYLQSMFNDKVFEILSEDGMNRAAVFFSNNVHRRLL